jgi:type I restriction enzyme S subunit
MASDHTDRLFGECAVLVRNTVSADECRGRPYVALEHIEEGTLRLIGVGDGDDVSSQKIEFRAGDILFGKLRPYFRKVVRPRFDGVCSTDIWVVRATDGIDQGFLYYWMASKEFVEAATRGSKGTKMPRADWGFVTKCTLPVPSLPVQRRIAEILGALDDKIELNRRMSETLEAMARALFKSWFVDFEPVRAKMEGRWRRGQSLPGLPAHLWDLFPDRLVDSQLGEIPEGWSVRTVGDICEFAYGKALREDSRRSGPIPVFGSNGQVGWHDEALVEGPGIVVGRKGNPGMLTWADSDFFPIDTTFYVVPRKEAVSLHYLFHALVVLDLPSLAADSAVPGLNRNMAYMSQVLLPDQRVVAAFTEHAAAFRARIAANKKQNRTLAVLRDTLLPKLLSGEIDVSGLDGLADPPAQAGEVA